MHHKYRLLIISFLLLNLFSWISYVEFKYGIPQVVKYVLSLTTLGVVIFYKFKNPAKPVPDGLFYPVIIVFVIWSIVLMLFAVLKFNSVFYIQLVLGYRWFFIPYLLPTILLFARFDLNFFILYYKYTLILIPLAILMQVFVIMTNMSPDNWIDNANKINIFDIGSWYLLLTAHISRKKYVSYFVIFYYILWIFLWSIWGRRGMLVEVVVLFIFMILMRLRSRYVMFADRMKLYLSGLVIIILVLLFGYIAKSSYAFQRGLSKEGFSESRSGVFEDFLMDFNSPSDWIWGRGLEGRVLRTGIHLNEDTGDMIENGFLHVILKGGLLYLVPFLIILIRASYLGLFRSNNDLIKALACLIIVHIIMMTYFNLPDYSTRYIFVWISVSVCYNPVMRNYSDAEIYRSINT